MSKTIKIYDQNSHQSACVAQVLDCQYDSAKEAYAVILNQTVFFPEGGGQLADLGHLGFSEVIDAQISSDEIITHYTKTPLRPDTMIKCEIDWNRRFDFMQQHSAEHILSGLVYRHFGYHNVGFHLGLTETTLDFDQPLTKEQLLWLEKEANKAIFKNIPIEASFPSAEHLNELDYRSKKELSGDVRIVTIPDYDICACCAPHVHRTGEISIVKIISAMVHRGGMRLTILAGNRALLDYQTKQENVEEISALLSAKQPEVASAVSKVKNDQQTLIYRINDLQKRLLDAELKALPSPDTTNDVLLFQKDLDTKAIRNAVNELCQHYTGYCGIFLGDNEQGYSYILGSATKDCRKIAGVFREAFGAKGGGSEKMIQGSIKASEKSIREIFTC